MISAPFAPVTLAFLAGILLGRLDLHPLLAPGCGFAALVTSLAWRRAQPFVLSAVFMLWVCLGMWRMDMWETHPARRLTALLTDELQVVRLHGIVRDDPAELFSPNDASDQGYPVIGPPPLLGFAPSNAAGVGRMVKQEQVGGRDVAPIGAGLQVRRVLPVGLHVSTCVLC